MRPAWDRVLGPVGRGPTGCWCGTCRAFGRVRAQHPNPWMLGKIKRKQAEAETEARALQQKERPKPHCALCGRELGSRVEWHHFVPKSKGGTETVPLHPICHRAIHAHVSNHDLASAYADLEMLRSREDIQRFLRWIAGKAADFHAPTRRARS